MAEPTLRVLLDGTPLLGHRTGIGRYTAALVTELAQMSTVDARVIGFTARGWRSLRSVVPDGVRATGLPFPARALRASWLRTPFPPVEMLGVAAHVVHGTNFVLPPLMRARGVVTVHDLAFLQRPDELTGPDRDLPGLVRASTRRADIVCTPTAAVADQVSEQLDVPRSAIEVTPLGVEPEWFEASPDPFVRQRHGLPDEYLLFVGADGPRKDLPTLLAAHTLDQPPLVIAGPGEPNRSKRIVRTGYLTDPDLRAVVAGAHALVLPSVDEGFGLPVLEAFACGVPVVCSDIPALREIAGGHARLFPPGDVDVLRQAIRDTLNRPVDSGVLRVQASKFSWRACAEATLTAYRRARE